MPSSLWASPGSSGISKTYASSAWSWCFIIAYFPSPTALAASPFLNSSDNSSPVSSCGFSNIPPTFAQYLSDLLASVVLISGNDFLPMTKSLYLGDSPSFAVCSIKLLLLFIFSVGGSSSNHEKSSYIFDTFYIATTTIINYFCFRTVKEEDVTFFQYFYCCFLIIIIINVIPSTVCTFLTLFFHFHY